jgi:hypothetical protein
MNPLRGHNLVHKAVIPGNASRRFLGCFRMSHEAECPEAVGNAEINDTVIDKTFLCVGI